MAYCRSCGLHMSDTATICPSCGTAVATMAAVATADPPMLIATFNHASGWSGKTVTYDAGRFKIDGQGEITAKDMLAYDARGQLDWAYSGLRDWVVRLGAAPTPPAFATGSETKPLLPSTAQPASTRRPIQWWIATSVALAIGLLVALNAHHNGFPYTNPGLWFAVAFAVGALFARRR